jgi:hypothetical protein
MPRRVAPLPARAANAWERPNEPHGGTAPYKLPGRVEGVGTGHCRLPAPVSQARQGGVLRNFPALAPNLKHDREEPTMATKKQAAARAKFAKHARTKNKSTKVGRAAAKRGKPAKGKSGY